MVVVSGKEYCHCLDFWLFFRLWSLASTSRVGNFGGTYLLWYLTSCNNFSSCLKKGQSEFISRCCVALLLML